MMARKDEERRTPLKIVVTDRLALRRKPSSLPAQEWQGGQDLFQLQSPWQQRRPAQV